MSSLMLSQTEEVFSVNMTVYLAERGVGIIEAEVTKPCPAYRVFVPRDGGTVLALKGPSMHTKLLPLADFIGNKQQLQKVYEILIEPAAGRQINQRTLLNRLNEKMITLNITTLAETVRDLNYRPINTYSHSHYRRVLMDKAASRLLDVISIACKQTPQQTADALNQLLTSNKREQIKFPLPR